MKGYPQGAVGRMWKPSTTKNYLEMLTIYLNTHIRVMCDNTTAVNVINHMGTSHYDSCNSLAKEIWERCITKDI